MTFYLGIIFNNLKTTYLSNPDGSLLIFVIICFKEELLLYTARASYRRENKITAYQKQINAKKHKFSTMLEKSQKVGLTDT